MSLQLAVVNGAILKCDKGTMPSPLTVTTNPFVQINARQVATVGDNIPLVNVFPFGVCSITQKPCIPITPSPWQPGGTGIHTGSPFLILPKNSLLGCMLSGFIEVKDAAQSTVFVDAPRVTKTEAWKHNIALLKEQEARARHADEVERLLAEIDAAIEADNPGGLGRQLLNTLAETGKVVIGDDPAEIGSNFLPWKRAAQLRHLRNLPGALRDTWKAIRGGRRAAREPIRFPSPPYETKPVVKDEGKLKNIVDDNYKETATVGSGSTADAIRHTRATGELVGGTDHVKKGRGSIRGLRRWLRRNPNAPPEDRAVAENIMKDLQDALDN